MKNKKLRVFINVNAPWAPSGYGVQANELVYRWHQAGYPVAVGCFYGLEGSAIELNGVKMYPKMATAWGDDGMVYHGKDFKADVTFSLQDIWTMDVNLLRQVNRWIPIVPIDHEPVPRAVFDRLKLAYRVVTYSKFGQQELNRWGMASTYIPHTVDTSVFKPQDKKALRKEFNIPEDIFLFGMVAANKEIPPRKAFQEAMDAFKLFHDKHPDSGLYFNTFMQQQGGFDIPSYANYLGISANIYSIDPYIQMYKVGKPDMVRIQNLFDCLLCVSLNEGFGVPIIEAQACGVPAIVNNITAMPELVIPGVTGEIAEVGYKRWSPLNAYVGVVDVNSLYDKMEKIFASDRVKMSEEARKFAVDNYDTEKIVKEKWLPFFEKLETECYPTDKIDNTKSD